MRQAASVPLAACCLSAWVMSLAEPPPVSVPQDEPHLFELLDAPPLRTPPPPPRGGARRQTIDYYFYYPREMSLSRSKRQSVQLLQQVMYKTQSRMRELAAAVAPHCTHRAYRMAMLHGKVDALKHDLHVIWSMAANNELTASFSMERLVYLYAHALRKYLDLTYIVEYLLLLHHRNVKNVYKKKARVDRLNAGGGTTTGAPGDTPGPAGDTTGPPGDTTGAPGDTTGAPGDTTGAPGDTTSAPGDTTGPATTASAAIDESATGSGGGDGVP